MATVAHAEPPVAPVETSDAARLAAPHAPTRRRGNHWARRRPEEFVRYPRAKQLPYLTECRLVQRAQQGDTDARNRLWVSHLRLVLAVVNRFHVPDALLADAFQEGAIGIKTAIEKFEIERYNSFSTYAWRWIYQGIQRFLVNNLFLARLPNHMFPAYTRFRRELRAAGTPEDERRVYDRWRTGDAHDYYLLLRFVPLAQPTPVDELDRWTTPAAPEEVEPDETDWSPLIADCLRCLKERERQIIARRHGLFGGQKMTLEEVAAIYGLTKERIRQIQDKAERKLRRRMSGLKHLLPFQESDADRDEE